MLTAPSLRLFLGASALVIAVGGTSSLLGACGSDPPSFTGSTSGQGGGNNSGSTGTGNGEGGAFVDNGAELFAALESDLNAACGTCHVSGGIADTPFMAGPDVYQSVLSWPGIVTRNPAESLFLTYSITGGGHSGTNLDVATPSDLIDRVTEWLEAEAAAIAAPPDEEVATIDPVTPILGFNAIYLSALGADYEGMAVTFVADELTPTSLELRDITIHTTKTQGVHFVHPILVVYPKGGTADPDPVDNFSGLDMFVPENTSTEVGVGLAVLTNWEAQAKISIAFETIEPYTLGGGQGGGGGGTTESACADVGAFTANAANPLDTNCGGCHGGNNGQATAALDMSDIGADDGAACGQVLNRVNTTTPAQSQIFVVTNPGGNAAHPFKFGGNATNFNNFVNSVTDWIDAE